MPATQRATLEDIETQIRLFERVLDGFKKLPEVQRQNPSLFKPCASGSYVAEVQQLLQKGFAGTYHRKAEELIKLAHVAAESGLDIGDPTQSAAPAA